MLFSKSQTISNLLQLLQRLLLIWSMTIDRSKSRFHFVAFYLLTDLVTI